MNYFAHGMAFLNRPYLLAGTAVPDWLAAADRQVRLRPRHVEAGLQHPACSQAAKEGPFAQLAQGILQHLADDRQFHRTQAFLTLSYRLSQQIGELLDNPPWPIPQPVPILPSAQQTASLSPRPTYPAGVYSSFVGHLLLEVLLDAVLIEENPARLEAYYQALDQVDAPFVQEAVNRMASRPTVRLAPWISEFRRLRMLWDYLEDQPLYNRLNQVLHRVGLPRLPEGFLGLLPEARHTVACWKDDLLHW